VAPNRRWRGAESAVAWRRIGDPKRGAACQRRAAALVDRCENPSTPALQTIDVRARLSPAERDTAVLAAAGRSNKDIASELCVSVRTVETRLQHVYSKLGVSGRNELASALHPTALHTTVESRLTGRAVPDR
jgi:DNA-binding NarL/FixJ family response regulator